MVSIQEWFVIKSGLRWHVFFFRGGRQKSYVIFKGGSSQMLTLDDKGGRGVRKHPKHADVIYEWSLCV